LGIVSFGVWHFFEAVWQALYRAFITRELSAGGSRNAFTTYKDKSIVNYVEISYNQAIKVSFTYIPPSEATLLIPITTELRNRRPHTWLGSGRAPRLFNEFSTLRCKFSFVLQRQSWITTYY
jgi:hypothetical protein